MYYQLKRDFIVPVVEQKWKVQRRRMVELLKSRDVVILVGDGRCDSPGFSAKYCIYTFMETQTGQVVDTVVIPVIEVANSNAMEKEGFIRILRKLKEEGVIVDIISTDKHVQIKKLMRVDPEFNSIMHQFDPWHIAKNICKKINKASMKKAKQALLQWVPSIVNHFWWSVTSSEKDPDLMYEKFRSIIYHTVNKHEWGGCKYFKKCAHSPLTIEEANKNWLVEGSEAHQYLVALVNDKKMKEDMRYLTESIHTTNVEVFNNVLLKYIPKQYHFEFDHMLMGTYLAALDNNFNAERCQEGKERYKIAWRKPTKKLIARKVYPKKRYDYLRIMLSSVYKRAEKGKKRHSRKRVMAPVERDNRENIIELRKKLARFSK